MNVRSKDHSPQRLHPYGKVLFYATMILIQAIAAALIVVENGGFKTTGPNLVLLTLAVTIAAGVREVFRELTGPEHKASKEVKRASHLLDFLSDRFPPLMNNLAGAMTASTHEERSANLAALQISVVTETSQLIPKEKLRVAYFHLTGEKFQAFPHCPGWSEKPTCPDKATGVILQTLRDETCVKVWSENMSKEKSFETLAFKLSDRCASLVAVPIRSLDGVEGFLYVESDSNVFEERAANLVVALAQLLAVAAALSNNMDREVHTLTGGIPLPAISKSGD